MVLYDPKKIIRQDYYESNSTLKYDNSNKYQLEYHFNSEHKTRFT